MNATERFRSRCRGFTLGLVGIILVACPGAAADRAADSESVFRWAPRTGELAEVSPSALKVGRIYNHYDRRLQRRVWSFYQGEGKFWYAFGEGTTQLARLFDLPVSADQAFEELKKIDPEFAAVVESTGQKIYLQLDRNNEWQLLQTSSLTSIYNAETGERWEMHFPDSYTPVSHSGGYFWTVRNGRYIPSSGYIIANCQ
jgi:hypothetical protein